MLKKTETERLLDKNVVFNDVKNICHVFLFFVFPILLSFGLNQPFQKNKTKLKSHSIQFKIIFFLLYTCQIMLFNNL